MRSGRAFAAATALLAVSGCDFWNNLVETKTLSRGNLELDVVDSWTGEALQGAICRDSLHGLDIPYEGNGAYRLQGAPTGGYSIRCGHIWYYDSTAETGLTGAGVRIAIKLARRVGQDDWYQDLPRQVHILHSGNLIRYPQDLEWSATPADDSGRFLYVWSFAVNKKLNRGPWPPQRQPPKEAYSPHFRTRISKENGIKPGPDKATLMVYSLLHDPKQPELVGSDSIDIEWVPNKLPSVQFDSIQFAIDSNGLPLLRLPVGCGEKGIRRIRFHANDSDGQCDSLRIWSLKGYAPSLPNFDTSLSCEMRSAEVLVSLIEPKKDDKEILSTIGTNGAIEYDNTLIAEIVDDNGERARDTAHFRTFRNVPPEGTLEAPDEKFYLVGDSVPFTVHAHDPDGFFSAIFVSWVGTDSNQYFGNRYMSNISRLKNDAEFTEYVKFNEAESTQFWATLADNCSETYETPRRGVHVAGSKPPVISKISLGQIHRAGDTLSVRLEVAGSDPDGSLFRDRIASVRIIWDEDRDADAGNIDSLFPNSSTFNVEMTHKYNRPASGPPIRINIRARDAHDSLADTTYLFNPPESLPPLTLPLR